MSRQPTIYETVAFDEVLHITDNGGVKLLIGSEEIWLPQNSCPGLEEFAIGDGPGECEVPENMAYDKGLV